MTDLYFLDWVALVSPAFVFSTIALVLIMEIFDTLWERFIIL